MQLNIEINGNVVTVEQNESLLFSGERQMYNREVCFSIINLDNKPVITVNEFKKFFKTSYEINTYAEDIKSYDVINKSLLKGYWIIEDGMNKYEIISHIGVKISIFKNGEQIANVIQKIANVFNTKTITLNYNKQENIYLLLGVALAMFGGFYQTHSTFTFNLGHLGPQVKKFDSKWSPKS